MSTQHQTNIIKGIKGVIKKRQRVLREIFYEKRMIFLLQKMDACEG